MGRGAPGWYEPGEEADGQRLSALVLIVEDRPEIQTLLGAVVRRQGHEPLIASSGAEALDLLDAGPSLIFADLGLPDMDGLDLVRAVRERPGFEGVPVVVITANVDAQTRVDASGLSGVEVVSKPFRFDQIAGIIGRYTGV